jgi:hypothetical protein
MIATIEHPRRYFASWRVTELTSGVTANTCSSAALTGRLTLPFTAS